MALVGEPMQGKRPHVKTEKMLEFIKTQEEQHKTFSCPYEGCTKVLTSYPGLKYHIKRNHEPQDEFSCTSCGRPFKSANGLRYHSSKGKCIDSCKKYDSASEDEGFKKMDSASDEEELAPNCQYEDHGAKDYEANKPPRKKLPPALDLSNLNDLSPFIPGTERLTEFAIIATSPLVQRAPIKPWDDHSCGMRKLIDREEDNRQIEVKMEMLPPHEDNCQTSTDRNGNYCDMDHDESTVTSTSQVTSEGVWSHQWPKPLWQCFIAGTKVCVGFVNWENVEDLALKDSLSQKAGGNSGQKNDRYEAPHGLRLIEIRKFAKLDNTTQSLVHLYFTPDIPSQLDMVAECVIDHPFFVRGKGWCSNDPILTERHYGIPCGTLEINDVCLPPIKTEPNETTTSYDEFTPMDRSAVYTLSTMAKKSSPKKNVQKKRQLKTDPNKPKRPPNAFMLFAKAHREEYTHKFPGKDNRAISVLLGDEWQKMSNDSRVEYIERARQIAEQQKKIHPDCWKRKK